jgi:uncharacterized protein (DUF1499 family)
MRLAKFCAAAALALSGLALCLLAIAPLGWRLGWWHYSLGLYRLMPASAFVAALAIAFSVFALVQGRSRLHLRTLAMLCAAFALSAILIYVPWQYSRTRNTLPPIHDVTTDIENPPVFKAVLAARAAERASDVAHRGPELAELQKSAYPDVVPLLIALPAASAFNEALHVAKSMPGWTIVASDADAGHIEATEQSRWFRFSDDVVIRIVAREGGSRIDMRSTSRQGRSDYGVNAARIRAFISTLRKRINGLGSGGVAATPQNG